MVSYHLGKASYFLVIIRSYSLDQLLVNDPLEVDAKIVVENDFFSNNTPLEMVFPSPTTIHRVSRPVNAAPTVRFITPAMLSIGAIKRTGLVCNGNHSDIRAAACLDFREVIFYHTRATVGPSCSVFPVVFSILSLNSRIMDLDSVEIFSLA